MCWSLFQVISTKNVIKVQKHHSQTIYNSPYIFFLIFQYLLNEITRIFDHRVHWSGKVQKRKVGRGKKSTSLMELSASSQYLSSSRWNHYESRLDRDIQEKYRNRFKLMSFKPTRNGMTLGKIFLSIATLRITPIDFSSWVNWNEFRRICVKTIWITVGLF